jgi:hypothetical protein
MYFVSMGIFLKGTEAAARAGLDLTNLTWGDFITKSI